MMHTERKKMERMLKEMPSSKLSLEIFLPVNTNNIASIHNPVSFGPNTTRQFKVSNCRCLTVCP